MSKPGKSTWQETCPRFKPILGAGIQRDMTADEFFSHVLYPVIATPKFDGIRCITLNNPAEGHHRCRPVCRSLDDVPNEHIFENIARFCPPGLDGEIMTYEEGDLLDRSNGMRPFNRVQSDVMNRLGMPLFKYHVFDYHDFEAQYPHLIPYNRRLEYLSNLTLPQFCVKVPYFTALDRDELEHFEAKCAEQGYEGICWRHICAPYKYGRSTLRQQALIKMKRFVDDEAEIIGLYEEMGNNNPITYNVMGYAERSSHKANMSPKGRLGGFHVRWHGVEFDIGSGFDASQREEFWRQGAELIGRLVTFKYQPHGMKEKPRTPIFKALRDRRDL